MKIHRAAQNKISVFPRELKQGTVYYARYKLAKATGDKRRYVTETLGTSVLEEALDKAHQRYAQISLLEKQGRAIRANAVSEEIDVFLKEYKQHLDLGHTEYSPHMLRGFQKTIGRYFKEYLGGKPLQDVSFEDLRKYETWRQQYWEQKEKNGTPLPANAKRRASARTLQWEVNAFKQFLRWERSRGRYSGTALDFNFRKGEGNRRSAFLQTHWNILTRFMQQKTWLRAGKHKNDPRIARHRRMLQTYVIFMANTGLRPGEARNLKWEDIKFVQEDDKPGSIRVFVSSSYSKVKKRRQVVGTSEAFEVIQRLKEERTNAKDHINPKDYIWCDSDGRLIKDFREGFNNLIRDAHVEFDQEGRKFAVYSLRHTYITDRLREGNNVYYVASNCGTSVAMIEKYYADVRAPDFAEALGRAPKRKDAKVASIVDDSAVAQATLSKLQKVVKGG